jgi:hypothetical protein
MHLTRADPETFRAWRVRPMSQRQRDDMVLLTHIREQHRLSLESYGRPAYDRRTARAGANLRRVEFSDLRFPVGIKNSCQRMLRRPLESAQYCSNEYQKRLEKHGFKVSMSGKGNCYDCEYGIAA